MTEVRNKTILRTITLLITTFSLSFPVCAQYSGGTGEPNDPYQIATAEDLMLLGETPEDYDKHFILTADINLDPNLPGRKVFDRAVIAPDTDDTEYGFQGTRFEGGFDGNGHSISNLTIVGGSFLGLFGQLASGARISNLGLEGVNLTGDDYVGSLVGYNQGSITTSYSTGAVSGGSYVGGLVGRNQNYIRRPASITTSYSTSSVSGNEHVGGLVGYNEQGSITASYSTGSVTGNTYVGGLVGSNSGIITSSVWDTETSGSTVSGGGFGGVGLTTAEMMDPSMLGLHGFANDPNWVLDAGRDYPRLAWEGTPGQIIAEPNIDWFDGQGTEEEPYRIDTVDQLILMGRASGLWDSKHFILGVDIDLDPNLPGRQVFSQAVIRVFSGVFDGNGHTISHLTISGENNLGLFGLLVRGATVSNLALEAVDIGGDWYVGGLVGYNNGSISNSYSTGTVTGGNYVGGLVGCSIWGGSITASYSTGAVTGDRNVGGLVGCNDSFMYIGNAKPPETPPSRVADCFSDSTVTGGESVGGLVGVNFTQGSITASYSTGAVTGDKYVGGLVGWNGSWGISGWEFPRSTMADCFSNSTVTGGEYVGGLVGMNYDGGSITNSYSTGAVTGDNNVGGLVGFNSRGHIITSSFWDIHTSGQKTSYGGTGLTTAEMQMASTFLDAGWDFVDDIENGIYKIWWINEGQDYPRLWWEEPTTVSYGGGSGNPNDPYMIGTAEELISLGRCHRDYGKHFILTADIDLNPNLPGREFFVEVVIAPQGTPFTGVFDGNGHTISNLPVGLFGSLASGAEVRDLGLVDVNISLGKSVGGLAKDNDGIITNCYSTGTITGDELVGGLVGTNSGSIVTSYSRCTVNGTGWYIGGLAGDNQGIITNSYSIGTVSGNQNVGGLVGFNFGGNVINSYSAGSVESDDINDLKVQHLYVLTRSGILEVSLAGGQRIIVHGHYDSHALKIKDDILYITEKTRGGDIVAYDLEGHYLRTIPTPPQANRYLTFVVLPDDKFALLDNSNDKVFFIDYEGNLIATTSIKPVRDSHLQNLDGIVVDNRLILSEDGDGRVLEIDLASYEMSIFKDLSYLPHWLSDIAYANGTYYICSPKIVYAFTDSGSALPLAAIQGYNITGIVVIEDYAYVSVNFAGKVYKVDLISGATSVLVSGINYPGDIEVSSADRHIGGFIGCNCYGDVINCFWDTETSGQVTSACGTGKTTAEMQTASTFLDAGWDFVDETENGTEDIWWIDEGQEYPRLWWEVITEN